LLPVYPLDPVNPLLPVNPLPALGTYGSTDNVNDAVALWGTSSVTVTVYEVAFATISAVPTISPVLLLKVSDCGNVFGLIAYL
jgi:hypothetical protein